MVLLIFAVAAAAAATTTTSTTIILLPPRLLLTSIHNTAKSGGGDECLQIQTGIHHVGRHSNFDQAKSRTLRPRQTTCMSFHTSRYDVVCKSQVGTEVDGGKRADKLDTYICKR